MRNANAESLIHRIEKAFASIQRPERFTTCECDECEELSLLLNQRTYETLTGEELDLSTCLLSPEGLTYWAPCLMKLSIRSEIDNVCAAVEAFVKSEIGKPLSKEAFPIMHPRFIPLSAEQTSVILDFLYFIEESWYIDVGLSTPREVTRAIRNWSRFASR